MLQQWLVQRARGQQQQQDKNNRQQQKVLRPPPAAMAAALGLKTILDSSPWRQIEEDRSSYYDHRCGGQKGLAMNDETGKGGYFPVFFPRTPERRNRGTASLFFDPFSVSGRRVVMAGEHSNQD